MSRLLTDAEIEALLASGPIVRAPKERIQIVIEAGRTSIPFADLPSLTPGALLPLDRASGDPVEVVANGTTIAFGHLIAAKGRLCVRIATLAKAGSVAAEKEPR